MKRLMILFMFFASCLLAAWEPFLALTLQRNMTDQVQYVMPERPLNITSVYRVETGQPFHIETAFILKEKAAKKISFTGSLKLIAPDGKVSEIFSNRDCGWVKAGDGGIFIAPFQVIVSFEKSDKKGKYRIELTMKDDSGNAKVTSREIEFVDSCVDRTPMDEKGFNRFLNFYYRDPQPGRIFAAWDYYLTTAVVKQKEKEGRNFNPSAVLLGFCEILKVNPQYHDEFAAMSRQAAVENHAYYAFIFAGLGKDFLKKYAGVINPDILTLVKRLDGADPFALKEITQAYQLDMLWIKFMVTGEFEPIRLLCKELRKRPVMSLEDAKKRHDSGKELTAEERVKLNNQLLQFAAVWSLQSNLQQGHILAAFYMETILARKLYTDNQEAVLIKFVFKNLNSKKGSGK